MAKIILRGKQDETLIWALDLAIATYDGHDDADMKADAKVLESLRASIEKQLGVTII